MHSQRLRVKMCGMTRQEDIQQACNLGADAIGLIFYEKSARFVTLEKAQQLTKNVPPFVSVVAVLVNPEAYFVQELLRKVPVQSLQFHGDESPNFCQQFNRPYIKAIQVDKTSQIEKAMQEYEHAQAILLDTPSVTHKGGTGLSFDWNIIPKHNEKPYILAGGLNEFNLKEAIATCKPYAIDVCSGVEALPGVKDPIKMSRFMKALGVSHL